MKRAVHLRRGMSLTAYCGETSVLCTRGPRNGLYDPPCTTFATEATCVRCLQLAVVEFEKAYMAAKYYDHDGNEKDTTP